MKSIIMFQNCVFHFVFAGLFLSRISLADKSCWWSFCQSKAWLRQGCQPPHLYYEKESRSCFYGDTNGTMYQCCSLPKVGSHGLSDSQFNLIDTSAEESGICSWYGSGGDVAQGSRTASGERFNKNAMTAAHRTLPFGTQIRVMNSKSKKTVDVIINDRGPFLYGRILDLTYAAFGKLENRDKGLIHCSYTIIS